jgi:hypothetical protein
MRHIRIGENTSLEEFARMELGLLRKGLRKVRKASPAHRVKKRLVHKRGKSGPAAPTAAPPPTELPETPEPVYPQPYEDEFEYESSPESYPEEDEVQEEQPEVTPTAAAPKAPAEAPQPPAEAPQPPAEAPQPPSLPEVPAQVFQPLAPSEAPDESSPKPQGETPSEKDSERSKWSKSPWFTVALIGGALAVVVLVYFLFVQKKPSGAAK